ncbi:MAG: hypothetical protein ACRDGE_05335 [Candidatus Limnocylindria bacterium]
MTETTAGGGHRIELTDQELRLVRSALETYFSIFGHEGGEPETVEALKRLQAKLPQPRP